MCLCIFFFHWSVLICAYLVMHKSPEEYSGLWKHGKCYWPQLSMLCPSVCKNTKIKWKSMEQGFLEGLRADKYVLKIKICFFRRTFNELTDIIPAHCWCLSAISRFTILTRVENFWFLVGKHFLITTMIISPCIIHSLISGCPFQSVF